MAVTDVVQVSTATETRQAAVALARSAVRGGLAASAQIIGPVASVFWHENVFGDGEEWIVLLRTTAGRYTDLEKHLIANHSWKNPEVVAVPICAGSAQYLDWVRRTRGAGNRD